MSGQGPLAGRGGYGADQDQGHDQLRHRQRQDRRQAKLLGPRQRRFRDAPPHGDLQDRSGGPHRQGGRRRAQQRAGATKGGGGGRVPQGQGDRRAPSDFGGLRVRKSNRGQQIGSRPGEEPPCRVPDSGIDEEGGR